MNKPKKSAFLKISCPRCKNQCIVYGKASSKTKCTKCKYILTKTSGGKTKIRAMIQEILC